MKVSVIIPVYNVAPYIQRCLLSVINQTYKDIECILIDDCGTDNSMDIARNIIEDYSGCIVFFIYSQERNKGLSVARNMGINLSTGEYIYFLDSDDAITPDCIETLVQLAKQYPDADIVQGSMVKELGCHDINLNVDDFPDYCNEKESLDKYVLIKTFGSACNRLIKRPFLIDNDLYFPGGYVFEDRYWLWFIAKKIKAVAFSSHRTYYYYINDDGISLSPSAEMKRKRIMGYRNCAHTFFNDIREYNVNGRWSLSYAAITLLEYSCQLCSFHSLKSWMDFWKYIFRVLFMKLLWTNKYMLLLIIIMFPPFCFFNNIKAWNWRIKKYIIANI